MSIKVAGVTSVLAAGLVLGSASFSPVHAYGVTAGKAITLNKYDIDKRLDPITWLVPAQGKLTQDLSATAVVTVSDFQADFFTLTFEITNTTQAAFKANILSFGLGVSPDASTVQATGGSIFQKATINDTGKQTFPGGFKGIDICTSPTGNCAGAGVDSGLETGESDTFTLTIGGQPGSFANGVTLTSYPVKFQTAYGSYEAAGVPEPITIVGSGLALGFGALLKRESSKKTGKAKVKV